ncbi:Hypothetical predicted protein [Paramuricea clavata]|uniref:DUF4371 domain-containing protein n=1 Tax=Paramuricea clavata TaxID=317549 RepID=A0A7D9EX78_PARCT|nr:Hypothetical predicted protein [Paramuricea clavata]
MAQYDEIVAKVISLPVHATKYLSPKIQNELIELLAKTVTFSLVHKINASPFCALILDSTRDITRIDQLSVIIRRVQIDGDKCSIEENFLGFVKLDDAMANGIVSTTKAFLQSLGINFSKIHGQGYDGASVMSGIHAGMQVLTRLSLTSTNIAKREDAKQLKNKIDKLEFVIFIVMWESFANDQQRFKRVAVVKD